MKEQHIFFSIFLLLFFSCSHRKSYQDVVSKASLVPYADQNSDKNMDEFHFEGRNFMVVSQGRATSMIGKKVLSMGGNAFDAFVAMSFAISVERQESTGIGGGGFLLFSTPGFPEPIAVDFREVAPKKISIRHYQRNGKLNVLGLQDGVKAAGVPGLVAGLWSVHKNFGSLPWKDLVLPAAELAEKGIRISPHLEKAIKYRKDILRKFKSSKELYFPKGTALKTGGYFVQKDLGKTLRLIAAGGIDSFYKGEIAKKIVKTVQEKGGFLSLKDLSSYQVKYRRPVIGTFRDYSVYSMPPPSSGGTHIVQMLNIIEGDNLKRDPYSAEYINILSGSMQAAFFDRAKYLGDPDFVTIPKGITAKEYALQLRKNIGRRNAPKKRDYPIVSPLPYESSETVHFVVADQFGNILSTTQTINGYMGSGVVVGGTGILLNNEMDDFSLGNGIANIFGAVGGNANKIAPKKRPLSSMSPTLVFKEGEPILALGSPSGTRIISCVFLTLVNFLGLDLNLYDAVHLPRFHHQWSPDLLYMEKQGFRSEVKKTLSKFGHTIQNESLKCKVQAIYKRGRYLTGVSDYRGSGLAIGE